MTRTIHRTYDYSWKTASPDDERDDGDGYSERDLDAEYDAWRDEQMQKEPIQAIADRLVAAIPVTLEELREIEAYLDNRADINNAGGPNEAMRLLTKLRTIIRMMEGR